MMCRTQKMAPCFQTRIRRQRKRKIWSLHFFSKYSPITVYRTAVSSHSRRSPNRTYQKLEPVSVLLHHNRVEGRVAIPVRRGACEAESNRNRLTCSTCSTKKATSCTYALLLVGRPDNSRMGLKQQVLSLRRQYVLLLLTYDRLL
jgi:hypothetical protein